MKGPTFPGKAYAVAFNANGTLYIGHTNGQVTTISMTTGIGGNFVKLSFAPSSITVENVRGRVYFSDTGDSLIQVWKKTVWDFSTFVG